MKLLFIIFVFILLAILDKSLTFANVIQVQKNFPQSNPLSIEKNPLVKFFFTKFGLIPGTILSFLLSIISMLVIFAIAKHFFGEVIAFYAVFMLYGIVICNNLFFLLKFSKVIA